MIWASLSGITYIVLGLAYTLALSVIVVLGIAMLCLGVLAVADWWMG